MAILTDEPRIRRLAGAILSDVLLYNGSKLKARPDADPREVLAEELAEGRGLFDSRVDPQFLSVFDQLMDERFGPSPNAAAAPPSAPFAPPDAPEPMALPASAPTATPLSVPTPTPPVAARREFPATPPPPPPKPWWKFW